MDTKKSTFSDFDINGDIRSIWTPFTFQAHIHVHTCIHTYKGIICKLGISEILI